MNLEGVDKQFLSSCPLLDGKYRVLFTLGKGRFAKQSCYQTVQTSTRTKYAIKIFPNTDHPQSQAFIHQCRMMLQAAHSSVIQILDVGMAASYRKCNGALTFVNYIVMPLAERGELFRLVQQTGRLSEGMARFFFKKIVRGLQNMHRVGLAHRDIKSENILLQPDFQLKIGDFGFATEMFDSARRKFSFDSSQKVGSPSYNAPEQLNQTEAIYDAELSDVFSTGVVLFEMLFSSAPFKSSSIHDQYFKVFNRPDKSAFWKIFSSICNPSKDCKDLLQRMMDPNPRTRIRISDIVKHHWFRASSPHPPIQKELSERMDAILSIYLHEQEQAYASKLQKRKAQMWQKKKHGGFTPQLGKDLLVQFEEMKSEVLQSRLTQREHEEESKVHDD